MRSLAMFDYEAVCDLIRATGDYYEGPLLRAVTERRPREGVIVDAGAHIGNHSVYWLETSSPVRVMAFEPMPETFSLLAQNLSPYPNAIAIPLALSDIPGPVSMVRDEANRGRSHISEAGWVPAQAMRLDDLALEGVSLLKVDVEGWQANVLRGAHRTIRRCHPALWVEDEEGMVAPTLRGLGLGGYAMVMEMPGENYLWEWTA